MFLRRANRVYKINIWATKFLFNCFNNFIFPIKKHVNQLYQSTSFLSSEKLILATQIPIIFFEYPKNFNTIDNPIGCVVSNPPLGCRSLTSPKLVTWCHHKVADWDECRWHRTLIKQCSINRKWNFDWILTTRAHFAEETAISAQESCKIVGSRRQNVEGNWNFNWKLKVLCIS